MQPLQTGHVENPPVRIVVSSAARLRLGSKAQRPTFSAQSSSIYNSYAYAGHGHSTSNSGRHRLPPKSRALPVLAVWLRDLIVSLAISAFIIIFLYQPVKVEGTSMMPSLDDQERIFVNKFVYRWEPIQRGDIVVFRYPRDPSKSYIKRVIGIAGDQIRIDTGQLYVNEQPINRRLRSARLHR